jgi:translation elongation factor IF5A
MQCSAIKKGGFVVIKSRPCKVVDTSTSKTGKHGHAKVNMIALDLFNGKKYEDICPSTHNMSVPVVKREEYQVSSQRSLIDATILIIHSFSTSAMTVISPFSFPTGRELAPTSKSRLETSARSS